MKPKLLITRAIEHAIPTQRDVAALGYETLLDPLLTIRAISNTQAISANTSALIVTSRNALQGMGGLANAPEFSLREFPLFVVGKETATLFAAAGYANIRGVAEQSADLPKLIKASVPAGMGGLLHITSQHAHTEFYDALLDAGYGIDQRLVYSADAATALQPDTGAALRENALSGALFYSARTAEIFGTLVTPDLQPNLLRLNAYCLSDTVAAAFQKTSWKTVAIAKSPNHLAMMELL
jgi:uroporphyrinogen-III synthase